MAFLSLKSCEPENSLFHILPIPVGCGVENNVENGPKKIIEASKRLNVFDYDTKINLADFGVYTHNNLLPDWCGDMTHLYDLIDEPFDQIIDRNQIPISLGGSHRMAGHIIDKIISRYEDVSIIALDAHAGDVVNKLFEHKNPHRNAAYGLRHFGPEEYAKMGDTSTHFDSICADTFNSTDSFNDFIWRLNGNKIYLSIDLCALDTSIMPCVCRSYVGGIKWEPLLLFLNTLMTMNVIGVDICGLAPQPQLNHCNRRAIPIKYKANLSVHNQVNNYVIGN
jgi:agmatinase